MFDELSKFAKKYDFDGDGIITINDYNIIIKCINNQLNDDPKYDQVNHTYNGKSLNISGDTDNNNNPIINVTDHVAFVNRVSEIINMIKEEIGQYIDVNITFNDIFNDN